MIVKLSVGFILGLVTHKATYNKTLAFGDRFGSLLRYTIGYILVYPIYIVIWDDLKDNRLAAYYLAGLSFGGGALLGHLIDTR